jgi:hypothetical protein
MLYYYNFTRNINDLELLQIFVKQNGFPDLLGFNSDGINIEAILNYELTQEQQDTLENLILNVYTNPVLEETSNIKISNVNSTSDALGVDGIFTGLYENVSSYSCITTMIKSSTLSLINGIEFHFSMDGITTDYKKTFTLKLNEIFYECITVPCKYFKLVFKNGGYAQTSFNIQTMYHVSKIKNIYDTSTKPYIYIEEEDGDKKTNGYFRSQGFQVSVDPGETEIYDFSWKYDIASLVIKFNTNTNQKNDTINLYIAPNTTIGVITESVDTGVHVLKVNSTVMQYMKVGFICTITDGINTQDLGEVYNINTQTCELSVDNNTAFAFNAGSYIRFTMNIIKDYIMADIETISHVIGDSKIGASYLPKNTIVRLKYTNSNATTATVFNWQVEYMY